MAESIIEQLQALQGGLGGLVGSHASAGRWRLANSVFELGLGDLTSEIRGKAEELLAQADKLDEPLRSEVYDLLGVSPSKKRTTSKRTRRQAKRRGGKRSTQASTKPARKTRRKSRKGSARNKSKAAGNGEANQTIQQVLNTNQKASTAEVQQILKEQHKLEVDGRKISAMRRFHKA